MTAATGMPVRSLTTRLTVACLRSECREVVVLGQQEHEHVVGRRVRGPHACRGRAAEFDARVLRENHFDVLRKVVLSGDEQDLLDAAGDDQLVVEQRAQVAGVEKAVRRARRCGRRRIAVIARADVVAANQDATDAFRAAVATP